LGFLGSFVLGFLSSLLVLVYGLFVSLLFGNLSFLSFLDLSNSFFCQSFFVFGFCVLKFIDSIKGNTFNGSLLLSFIISSSFSFTGVSLFNFFMESSPGGGPSQSLGFNFPKLLTKYFKAKVLVLLAKKRKGLPSLATYLIPFPG